MKTPVPGIESLRQRLDLESRIAPYERLLWDGSAPVQPTLHVEDVSAIPFLVGIPGVELYQHRARVRAGRGDLFVSVTPPSAGYEAYCRETLGLGAADLAIAEPKGSPLEVAKAATAGKAFEAIVARARVAGGLVVHPYMAIEDVWQLAAAIEAASGAPVAVVGPPPPVTWIANDKALFSEVVEATLGPGWLVETRRSAEPGELARFLVDMAGRHRRVGLKRTRCASAMGNQVWASRDLTARTAEAALGEVEAFLARTEWAGGEEVLVVAWEDTDISPSTQLWIPPAGRGEPRLDGIYEQILSGAERVFVGSRPSRLSAVVNRALGEAALEVAGSLQALGYTGRCSFDHLVLGDPSAEFKILFTECNGRWGGTSTPMSLVDRLLDAPRPRPPYRAQDYVAPSLSGASFPDLLARLEGDLFDRATGRGRFVLYNVGPLAAHGKFDVISLGRTQEEAEEGVLEVLPRLLARG